MSQINLRFDGLRVARRAVGVRSCQFWRFRGSMRCSRCVAGVRGARWWWLLAVVLVGWRCLWAALAVVGGVSWAGSGCVCGAGGRRAFRFVLGVTCDHLARVYA